jgi:hypothetical protein
MAYISGPKFTGTILVDLSPLKDDLVDLEPGALQGCRAEGDGLGDVLTELATAMPNHGDEAEIHPASYPRVLDATTKIAALRAKEIELAKMLEVCRESRARLENNREEDLSAIGTQAETKAAKANKPGLLANFEKTIAYKARIADKAAGTRRKNAEEAAQKKAPSPA